MTNPLNKLVSIRLGVNIKGLLNVISSTLGIEPIKIPSVIKYSSDLSTSSEKSKGKTPPI